MTDTYAYMLQMFHLRFALMAVLAGVAAAQHVNMLGGSGMLLVCMSLKTTQ